MRLFLSGLPFLQALAGPTLVETDSGPLQGVLRNGGRQFLGVPFAADASGPNRWSPPQPVAPWSSPFDASSFGPGCMQRHNNLSPANVSENCLTLNVFAPLQGEALPVMFWIHGGRFDEGDKGGATLQLYNGGNISKLGVVVVAANYRLGALGWLDLPQDLGTSLRGNFGLMDQRYALRWVQRNIQAFGGDPRRVTIWGESAGAMSVGIHLAAAKSRPLFSQAILESYVGVGFKTHAMAAEYGRQFVAAFPNCSSLRSEDLLACLRSLSSAAVLDVKPEISEERLVAEISLHPANKIAYGLGYGMIWMPSIDEDEFPEQVLDVFARGAQHKVPTLVGSNSDEATAAKIYANRLEVGVALSGIFGPSAWNKIRTLYPQGSLLKKDLQPLSAIVTDFAFRCPGMWMLRAQVMAGVPAFGYRFAHHPSLRNFASHFGLPQQCESSSIGAVCHGVELPWVFQNYMIWTPTKGEEKLGTTMGDFWSSFARDGRPTSSSQNWPEYGSEERNIRFDAGVESTNITTESWKHICDAWREIGYQHLSQPLLV